jgi:hypothetical protein
METLQCLNQQEATDLVRYCLGEGGEIIPGKHFRDALVAEGLTFEDTWGVLRTGNVYDPPEQDIRTSEWKYRLEGYEPGGKWIVIVLSFKSLERTFLITVFSVKTRKRRSHEKN